MHPIARPSRYSPLALGLTLGLMALAPMGCESSPKADEDAGMNTPIVLAEPVTIVSEFHGDGAEAVDAMSMPGLTRYTSADALPEGPLTDLDVDFDTQELIVLQLGEQPSTGYWAHITGIQRDGDTLFVEGTANQPADDAMTGSAMTAPWCAVIIDQTGATTLRSDIESVTGQPRK